MIENIVSVHMLAVASLARCRHGRQKVLIPKCSCSCVETLVMLRAKFHVVSSLLSVLKKRDFDAITNLPLALPFGMSLTQKRKYSKS